MKAIKTLAGGLVALSCLTYAVTVSAQQNTFITLGTASGPLAPPDRSQPANALIVGSDTYLVDAGDGAAGQLPGVGIQLVDVKGVFLSHLHFDHTGGLLAILGLRAQLNAYRPLEVYGPPGTQQLIDGLHAAMEFSLEAAYGNPGPHWASEVLVTELVDGSTIELDGLTVTVAENSHFSVPPNAGFEEKAKSLSFRFDMDERSIVYTGDTGPSENVVALARDADLLVSEMMDVPFVLENVRRIRPDLPAPQFEGLRQHLITHHITPQQVGELATAANVERVVITHFNPHITTPEQEQHYRGEIAEYFDGQIEFAVDLDRF